MNGNCLRSGNSQVRSAETRAWQKPGFWLLLAALAAVATAGIRELDFAFADVVRRWHDIHPDSVWHAVSFWFGKTGTLAICPLAAMFVLVRAWWFRPNYRVWRACLWLLAAEGLNGLAGLTIKLGIGRWRPNQPLAGTFEWFHSFSSKCQSFPSGHTADVAAVATVLWFAYPRLRPLYIAWVVAMAAARIGVMRHFLSDTAVGAAMGIICALLVQPYLPRIENWIETRFALRPQEDAAE